MRGKRGLALILAGVFCLLAAAGFYAYNVWDADRAGQTAAEGLSAVAMQIESARAEAHTQPETRLPASVPQEVKQMPAVETDGRLYVGVVEIPSLGLTLPVLSEWSYANLKIAPCRYAGSCYTDDLVLCAHNYRSHFNALRWVDMGEEVYFTTADGESFRYVIVNRETLDPDETEYLTDPAADWDLTLFTCYVGGATRCVIRCERAD
jgi:sortase A